MDLAACLRGVDPMPLPPVTTKTIEEYLADANAELAEDPPPNPNHYERALAMLRLVTPGELSKSVLTADDVKILGYFRRAENDIVLIDRAADEDAISASQILVHEFIHALQDRDVDLVAAFDEAAGTYDSYLGYASVVEGEARMHESRFEASLLGLDPGSIDWNLHFQSVADYGEHYVLESDTPYSDTWGVFGYSLGARFVHHAWQRGGPAAVRELLDSPPSRARAVLASISELVVDDWPEPEFTAPEPPTPWTLWADETLGAWGVELVMAQLYLGEAAQSHALDWRGDRLWIYADDQTPARTTLVWDVEFASVDTAIRVESALRGINDALVRNETRVVVASSTSGEPLDWALAP
jgi:hypothetical protein